MRKTQKYTKACELATLPHQDQDSLYKQLNEIGFFWNSKLQQWERDDRLAEKPSDLIRIRVWAAGDKVGQAADIFIESAGQYGLKLQERSEAYPCRPPKQADSRIYLTFTERESG